MATTQFKPPEARAVELPKSHSQIQLPDKDVINITVTKYDSIYVDIMDKAMIEIDGQQIESTVRRVTTVTPQTVATSINRARAKNMKALVVIKADKKASFGIMQDVMKSMQDNSLERFLIITETVKG